MAKPIHLDIVTGIAERVELFNEPAPAAPTPPAKGRARGERKAVAPARGVNAMRLMLRDVATSKDREFVIRNSTVQVHERHRVTIIRAKQNRSKELRIVAVVNQSTGQWEDRPHVIDHVTTPRPYFGPLWKAAGLSALLTALVFLTLQLFAPDPAAAPPAPTPAIEEPAGPSFGRGRTQLPEQAQTVEPLPDATEMAPASRQSGWPGRIVLAILWGLLAYPVFWGAMQIWHRVSHRNRARLSKELLRAEIDHQVAIATAMANEKEG